MSNDQTKIKIDFADYIRNCVDVAKGIRTLDSLAVRECGDCSLCCTAPAIDASQIEEDELDRLQPKPACQSCKHSSNRGCGIYQKRPSVCADYQCLWLAGLAQKKPSEGGVAWCLQPCHMTGAMQIVGHSLDNAESLKDVDVRKDIRSFLDFRFFSVRGEGRFPAVVMRDSKTAIRFDNTGNLPHLMADVDQTDPMRMEIIEFTERRAEWLP